MAEGSLGCSDHLMVEFRILHGESRAIRRITTLDFRTANFGLFKDLLGGIPWVKALDSVITSLVLKISASPQLRNQTKETGDLHG